MPANSAVERILKHIDSLPTLPTILQQILLITARDESCANDLVEVVSRDQSLTADVLRVANSPVFGVPYRIQSAKQAIVLLGFNEVRNLAMSVSVFSGLTTHGRGARFDRQGFWRHSGLVAHLTRRLYEDFPDLASKPLYYTAGLLHDVGVVVLDRFFAAEFQEIIDTVRRESLTPQAAEKRHLGVTHSAIGATLLRRWQLPTPLVDAIDSMHAPWLAQDRQPLRLALFYANLLAELLDLPSYNEAPKVTLNDFYGSRDAQMLQKAEMLLPRDQLAAQLEQLREDEGLATSLAENSPLF